MGAAKPSFRARLLPILTLSAHDQTGWNVTKCHACHAKRHDNLRGNPQKEMFCSFPHRHSDVSRKPETQDETRGRSKTSISCETSSNFDTLDTLSNRLECHKVPRLPRKTCVETFKKERFCSFPHRHGIADDDPTMTRRDSRRTRVQPPDPQTINGNPSLRIREKTWMP